MKVPPSISQFQHVLDRNTAAQAFKLLNKYRPETKAEKKERLTKEATAIADGKKKEDVSKKPYVVKCQFCNSRLFGCWLANIFQTA